VATKAVVAYAKRTGALVESEPHYLSGSSNVHPEAIDYEEIQRTFTTPEGARQFIAATGIDTFAVAIALPGSNREILGVKELRLTPQGVVRCLRKRSLNETPRKWAPFTRPQK
jgi:Fructose-bisphosphate aldolase class-II